MVGSVMDVAATDEIYTLSLHDALPISEKARAAGHQDPLVGEIHVDASSEGYAPEPRGVNRDREHPLPDRYVGRSEEHTPELQSPYELVCRHLLEKKKTHNEARLTETQH